MSGSELHDEFARLLVDEPPLVVDLDPVVTRGRRLRRRRQTLLALGSASAVAVVAAAVVVPLAVTHHDNGRARLTVAPLTETGAKPPPRTGTSTPGLTAEQRRVLAAVEEASPTTWTFEATADRWNGTDFEGTADDGAGPGRVSLGWTTENGSQQLHPCNDPEFRAGVTCTERTLTNGSVLSLRSLVDYRGVKYVDVALTHPDGTGVNAESGNFTLTWPLPSRVTAEEKKDLVHVSRDAPTYTVGQLGEVVVAVDRALGG